MTATSTSLLAAFDYVWGRLMHRIEGLTDEEYRWEPVAACWSLRQDDSGAWRIEGSVGDTSSPMPTPVTTIAWRLGHLAGVALGGFADRWFGSGTLRIEDIEFPGAAAGVPSFCEENYRRWREGIASIEEGQWWEPLGASWGIWAEANHVDLAIHVFDEVVHHGAEVGLLRDLYPRRAEVRC